MGLDPLTFIPAPYLHPLGQRAIHPCIQNEPFWLTMCSTCDAYKVTRGIYSGTTSFAVGIVVFEDL